MPDTATAPRWIIVVRRDRADLFASLKRAFPGGAVEPVLDRRLGERRQDGLVVVPNRRRRTRRRKPAARDQALWEVAGFRLTEAAGAGVERWPAVEAPVEVIVAATPAPAPAPRRAAPAEPSTPPAPPLPVPARPTMPTMPTRVVPLALQPALPGLAAMVGSLGVTDADGERLRFLAAWLCACREALPTERLDVCRAYLGLAVRTLAAARPAPGDPDAGDA